MVIGLTVWSQFTGFASDPLKVVAAILAAVGAATGGYFSADMFGRKFDPLWKSASSSLFGAVFATLIGSTIGGAGLGMYSLFVGAGELLLVYTILAPIFILGLIFGWIFVGTNSLPFIVWMVGFLLLEIIVRTFASDLSEEVPRQ